MVGWMAWGMAAGTVDQQHWRKGPWTPEEDNLLTHYITQHGEGRWNSVSRCAGLNRSGKSCRLRWVNYLRPGLKRGQISPQEEGIIIELHALWGNKWSTIARYLPGRTDNEIKNYWRTHFKKRDRLPSHKTKSRKIRAQKQIIMQPPQQKPLQQAQEAEPLGETKVEEDNKIIGTDFAGIEDCHFGQLINYSNNQDESLWSGSLWSFNEPVGACNTTARHDTEGYQVPEQNCSKVANLPNQATLNDFNGFSWGSGDYSNCYMLLYNEGYTF